MPIPMFDPIRLYEPLQAELRAAAGRVLGSGRFVLGPEVEGFEREVAARLEARFAVGVSSGTDALVAGLLAAGVGAGDEVVCPAFSFVATSEAIRRVGARPVFVDVNPRTFDLDVDAAARALTAATRAVVCVHLFGLPCDVLALRELCDARGLALVEDAAQAFGATVRRVSAEQGTKARGARGSGASRVHVGTVGDVGCFSFFPAKVLGGFGDGGLVTTNESALAQRVRRLRQHGLVEGRAAELGGNYRLDALQAALLRVVLPHVDGYIARRRSIAARYDQAFRGLDEVDAPARRPGGDHVYSVYALRVAAERRDALRSHLREREIDSAVYYEAPLHLHPANADLGYRAGSLPVAEGLCGELVALPVHPGLTDDEVQRVVEAVCEFFR